VHNDTVTIVATDVAGNKVEQLITVSVKGKLVRGCPFYAISNTFIYDATIKVGYLSVINSSCNRGISININCSGLRVKYWACVGTDADKFSITTDTGILTYTEKQTSVHNDTVTIVATDVAGNKVVYLRLVYRLDWLYEHQQSNHPSHRR
jgi:hypothetical protein